MQSDLRIACFVARWTASPFGKIDDFAWRVTQDAEALIRAALESLREDYRREGGIACHRSASIESGAVLKAPAIVGPRCFIAAGAYLRGGTYLDEGCIVGPACELKTSFMFQGAKLAHLNFVGDSVLGAEVNVEAGAIVANYRNEFEDKAIRIRIGGELVDTGVEKFGALIGDGARIGANAVIAPGVILAPNARVPRLGLVDQHPV